MNLWLDPIPPSLRARARAALEAGNVAAWLLCAGNDDGLALVANNDRALQERGLYEQAFLSAYCGTRGYNLHIPLRVLHHLFTIADRSRLRAAGDPLPGPGPFVVYRGVAGRGRARRVQGYSWTGSRDVATWYAQRFARFLACPAVLELTVEEPDVLAYLNWRQEDEFLVIVPDDVRIRRVPVSERRRG